MALLRVHWFSLHHPRNICSDKEEWLLENSLEENDLFLKYSCQDIGEKVLYSALFVVHLVCLF
jgi:hypothetical protein